MPVVVSGSASPTPAAVSYSTLKTKVARYVLESNATTALSVAGDCIRDAVMELNTRRWKWAIVYQDVTLVAGTAAYDLAAPFKAPRKAELINSNSKAVGYLKYMDPFTFLREFPDRTNSGDPYQYTVDNAHEYGQVILSCSPSAAFVASYPTLRLWFYRRVQVQSGDSDVLDIPAEVESFVEWRAKETIASLYDQSKVGYANQRANLMWTKLVRDDVTTELGDWN